jgi:hypothetical protein
VRFSSPRNAFLVPSGFFVTRLSKFDDDGQGTKNSAADLGVFLNGSQTFEEINAPLLEELETTDPSLAKVLRTDVRRFDNLVLGLKELVSTLYAENCLINEWREENNNSIRQMINEIKAEASPKLTEYENRFNAVDGPALQADIKARMLENQIEALKNVEPKHLELLAKRAGIPAPPKKPKFWTVVTNSSAIGSGIFIGFSLVKLSLGVDFSALDAGSILVLSSGSIFGSLIGLGVKGFLEKNFGSAAWSFHRCQPFIWPLVFGSLAGIGFVALEMMLFKAAANSINFFQDFAAGTSLEARNTSSLTASMAVTVPMTMMAAVSGWIFGWEKFREAFLKAEQEADRGERTSFDQIARLKEELATTKGFRDGFWEERWRRAADLNNHDSYVAHQIEDLQAKIQSFIDGLTDEQISMIDRAIKRCIGEWKKVNETLDSAKLALVPPAVKEIISRRIEPSTGGVKAKFGRWLKGGE